MCDISEHLSKAKLAFDEKFVDNAALPVQKKKTF